MCSTCGCSSHEDSVTITRIGKKNHPQHSHGRLGAWGRFWHFLWYGPHQHYAEPTARQASPSESKTIQLEQDILSKNNQAAQRNRGYFEAKKILALNLVSSPGSGKTSILERTLHDLQLHPFYVIEGDQQTTQDADRIAATGVPVVQINTGQGCHLDADMVYRALTQLRPVEEAVVLIENVGNLVCPALFDLGESARVVIISVTEGDDKPIKYPDMFHSAQLCLINKIDLLPYVNFDVDRAKDFARQVNPNLEFIAVSATTGQGMEQWYQWLTLRQHTATEPEQSSDPATYAIHQIQ